MNLNLLQDDYNNHMKKIIKITLSLIVIFSVISLIFLVFYKELNFLKYSFLDNLKIVNATLSIISVASCWTYYYIYKKREFLLITLVFFSLAVENIFGIIRTDSTTSIFETTTLSIYMLRTFILALSVIKKRKLTKFIEKNKILSVLVVSCLSAALLNTNIEYFFNYSISNLQIVFFYLNIVLVLCYVFILIFLAKKSIVSSEIVYTIIIASISCFTIRRIYALNEYFTGYDLILKHICDLFIFVGFSTLVIGLFCEFRRKIKENEKITEKLAMNENNLLKVTENIQDLIITTDKNGNIVYVNNAVINTLGYSKEELIGKIYTSILLEKEDGYFKISDCNKNKIVEYKAKCKNNKILDVESIHNVVSNENIIGQIIVSRDLSYRNELQEMKEKYNEIKEYDKIKTEFFANLSHEVRTPINVIYSCVQLLNTAKSKGNTELERCYIKYEKTIKQNCYRMLKLINNLLDITKLESGFIKKDFKNHNIVKIVEDITLSLVPFVDIKKIDIIFDTEVEEIYIRCDKDKIERIILNLLSNAIKFTEIGGKILVYISVNDKWVEIRVKDNGIGIPKNLRKFVFRRFMQTDKSLNRKKEGTGIGLALVKSLVELHDGKVYIEDTKESEGSEFVVKLLNIRVNNVSSNCNEKNMENDDNKKRDDKINLELSDIYDLI